MQFDHALFLAAFDRYYRTRVALPRPSQMTALDILLTFIERDAGWTNTRQLAYALATTAWESAYTFRPILELGDRRYFDKYEGRHDLGNTQHGDGFLYRGRGFVQVTGRANYTRIGKLIGVDLASSPDVALSMKTGYTILSRGMREGWFTGKKLSDYINEHDTDYVDARRIINGQDKAGSIARMAAAFEAMLNTTLVSNEAVRG